MTFVYQLCLLSAFPSKMRKWIFHWHYISVHALHVYCWSVKTMFNIYYISSKIWPSVVMWHQLLQKWCESDMDSQKISKDLLKFFISMSLSFCNFWLLCLLYYHPSHYFKTHYRRQLYFFSKNSQRISILSNLVKIMILDSNKKN